MRAQAATIAGGGDGIKKNLEKALSLYKRSVALGNWGVLAHIPGIFLERGQAEAAKKYWIQFFQIACDQYGDFADFVDRIIGTSGFLYCEAVAAGELEHCIDNDLIIHFSALLKASIEKNIAILRDKPDRNFVREARLLAAYKFIENTTIVTLKVNV